MAAFEAVEEEEVITDEAAAAVRTDILEAEGKAEAAVAEDTDMVNGDRRFCCCF